jgi:hypothetical protein
METIEMIRWRPRPLRGQQLRHGRRKLTDVPVGVDVAGRLNRGVPEQLLHRLEVAGAVEHPLPRRVTGLVHPLIAQGQTRRRAPSLAIHTPRPHRSRQIRQPFRQTCDIFTSV